METVQSIERQDRRFFAFNGIISALALGFLAWLLLANDASGGGGGLDLGFMPAVNACFNGLSAVLLSAGWVAIRNGRK